MQLDQQITLTRSAFAATLQIDNAPQNLPLEEVTSH